MDDPAQPVKTISQNMSRLFSALFFLISVSCSAEVVSPGHPSELKSTAPPLTVPARGSTPVPGRHGFTPDCPAIDAVQLTLRLNEVNQVRVQWQVHGGCEPYQGILTAWYQDEFKPYATYRISSPKGRLLDAPILHLGKWDIDYTLEITDRDGHFIRTFQTIAVGR